MASKKFGFEPVYRFERALYVNLTNRCTNRCSFCVRDEHSALGGAETLWLEREPETAEVLDAWKAFGPEGYDETVFCGYGEPTARLETLLESARAMKAALPGHRIRLNTNGQAVGLAGKPVAPLLEGLFDSVSISLNAASAQEYVYLCAPENGEAAYGVLLQFAKDCKAVIPEVALTIVAGTTDENRCRGIADSLGLPLRIRGRIG